MADDKNLTQVNAAAAVEATHLIPIAQGDARLKRATAQQVADFAVNSGVRTRPETGAVNRTLIQVLQDWSNARDWGVLHNGTDERAKIQSAVNSIGAKGGGELIIDGPVTIGGEIVLANDNVTVSGTNRRYSLISSTDLDGNIFNVTGARCKIRDLSTIYTGGTPVSGATAIRFAGGEGVLSDIHVFNCWDGIQYLAGGQKAYSLEITDYENTGINCTGVTDIFVSLFRMSAGNTTRGRLGGIRMFGQCESVNFHNGSIISGKYSMTNDASSFAITTRPAYNNFSGVYFDAASDGTYLDKLVFTVFAGCWFSGGREGATDGVRLLQSRSVGFVECQFVNCGHNGLTISPSSVATRVIGGAAYDNSITATGYHGIFALDGASKFSIVGVSTGNGLIVPPFGTGQQSFGVVVGAGCDKFRVRDITEDGNLSGTVFAGTAAGSGKVYADNF